MIPGSFHSCYLQFKPQQSGGGQLRGSGELWPHQLRPGISVPSIPTAGLQPGGPLLTPARQTPVAASWAAAETLFAFPCPLVRDGVLSRLAAWTGTPTAQL